MNTDRNLLDQAASGDATAFEAFAARHREAVWRFARSLTRNPASAEDALQLAERLHQAVSNEPMTLADKTAIHLTVSIGVAGGPADTE